MRIFVRSVHSSTNGLGVFSHKQTGTHARTHSHICARTRSVCVCACVVGLALRVRAHRPPSAETKDRAKPAWNTRTHTSESQRVHDVDDMPHRTALAVYARRSFDGGGGGTERAGVGVLYARDGPGPVQITAHSTRAVHCARERVSGQLCQGMPSILLFARTNRVPSHICIEVRRYSVRNGYARRCWLGWVGARP